MPQLLPCPARPLRPALLTLALATLSASLAAPLAADEFRDTMATALEAYDAGDIRHALEELAMAQRLLQQMQAGAIESFLPPTPEGWQRQIDGDFAGMLAMMGGGTGVEASYRGPAGERLRMQIAADSPMLGAFLGIFANPAMLGAMGGTVHRIGRERVLERDGEMTMILGNRILVQLSGGDSEQMLEMLRAMDLDGLARFGT